jgi:hypothetical protein
MYATTHWLGGSTHRESVAAYVPCFERELTLLQIALLNQQLLPPSPLPNEARHGIMMYISFKMYCVHSSATFHCSVRAIIDHRSSGVCVCLHTFLLFKRRAGPRGAGGGTTAVAASADGVGDCGQRTLERKVAAASEELSLSLSGTEPRAGNENDRQMAPGGGYLMCHLLSWPVKLLSSEVNFSFCLFFNGAIAP